MMMGRMEGRRGRDRPHCNNIQKYLSNDIINLRLDARDRAGWRIAIMDVTRGWFQLDGTR